GIAVTEKFTAGYRKKLRWRCRNDGRIVRTVWPCNGHRGLVHLYSAGVVVQGFRATREDFGCVGFVDPRCFSCTLYYRFCILDAIDDRTNYVDGHSNKKFDPAY